MGFVNIERIAIANPSCPAIGSINILFLFTILHPTGPTLFPYTTLFRSSARPTSSSASSFATPVRSASRPPARSEEHTSELQSRPHLVCRLLPQKKNGGLTSRVFSGATWSAFDNQPASSTIAPSYASDHA